ncbi:MAG: multidrug effflux MFS transporter [Pseudomonadota bacterium]
MGRREFVVLIAGLMALNALAIDIMLPALGTIAADLKVASANDRQLVVVAYILGFGFPQIVFGPLTDRLGRKPILYLSLAGYALMGVACIVAGTFTQLLVFRFFQGVFASGVRVVAVSTVRDVYVGRGMARTMSLIMTIFMAVPILAPSIGKAILQVAPWEWTFGVLSIAAVGLGLWCMARLPETLPIEARAPLNVRAVGHAYLQVFQTRETAGYMLASGVVFGSLFAFIASSEQVFTEVFGRGETFTLWFAGIAAALSVANFTNSRLVERFGMRRLSHGAILGFIASAGLLLLLMATVGEVFWIFFPLFALCFAFFGLIGSNFNAMAMEPLGKIAGTASAAYGFATTTLSGIIGGLIGRQFDGTTLPVLTGYVVLGVTCLAIVFWTERGKLFRSR